MNMDMWYLRLLQGGHSMLNLHSKNPRLKIFFKIYVVKDLSETHRLQEI